MCFCTFDREGCIVRVVSYNFLSECQMFCVAEMENSRPKLSTIIHVNSFVFLQYSQSKEVRG